MRINKVTLYNFNSYEGINEFDFSEKKENKNIYLIGGRNGAGKTSLFSAIKTALYGPLAYGYIGSNPHYIAKIKDCINSKAFQMEIVESYVQINVSLMVEREYREYVITRKWLFTKQKVEEYYTVVFDGETLDDQQLSYFQNYLQSIIPPDLFEFFLFDGEAVGSIFSTSSYNAYVKNAIYTLCGLDIFEIIRKYTKGYAGKAMNENEALLHDQYEELRENVVLISEKKDSLEKEYVSLQEQIDLIQTALSEIETAYKKAGGITESDRNRLLKDLDEAERIKTEAVTKIKMFVEGIMPFMIVSDFAEEIKNQVELEEKGEIYNYIQQKLHKMDLRDAINDEEDSVSDEAIESIVEYLLTKFKPRGWRKNSVPIFDLSREEMARVNGVISSVEDYDVDEMIQVVNQRKKASEKTARINKKLKNAIEEDDAKNYIEKENQLLKARDSLNAKMFENRKQYDEISAELVEVEQQREKALQDLKNNAQNKHVFELSSGIEGMMSDLLRERSISIKQSLEKMIVDKLRLIYRKENLITHIEIDDNYEFNLYQDAKYIPKELEFLIKNLGKDEFRSEIGQLGWTRLFSAYGVDDFKSLQNALSDDKRKNSINLYKRIDISRLSKGERQIFILSLYWAIIELSGQDIPFVIDTPYARIDANHRKEISKRFFPNISKQVIILSTDEEINEEYYRIIKPYISREYLLVNDEKQNHTTIEKKYFFGDKK